MKQIIGLVTHKSDKNHGIKINNMWVNFTPEEYEKFISNVDLKYPVRITIDDDDKRNVLKWESMKDLLVNETQNNEQKTVSESFSSTTKNETKNQNSSQEYYSEKIKLEVEKQDDIKRQVLFKGSIDIVLKLIELRWIYFANVKDYADVVCDIYERFLERFGLNNDKKY